MGDACCGGLFFCKQKTAYEMTYGDWSSDVCSSDLVEKSKQTEFCLSCHVMEPYGRSLHVDERGHIPAVHYQNHLVPADRACFTCHTTYTLFGDYNAKLHGLRHVYVQYLGTIPKEIKLYEPYNNRECLHCHLGARSFEEGAMHNVDPA